MTKMYGLDPSRLLLAVYFLGHVRQLFTILINHNYVSTATRKKCIHLSFPY